MECEGAVRPFQGASITWFSCSESEPPGFEIIQNYLILTETEVQK